MLLAAIARRRRLGGEGRADVLSLLIEARDETNAPLAGDARMIPSSGVLVVAGLRL